MKHKFWVDSHKGASGAFTLGLIAWYHAWDNMIAWIYLALHGTYGVLWILKSHYFGDKLFDREIPFWYGLVTWFGLSLYWIGPWLIVTGRSHPAPPWFYAICISMFSFGVFFHFASDMQKHMMMTHKRGTLLTEGLWSRLRNPNYFGELLIYLGFSLVPLHWAPLAALATMVATVWVPNMIRKDKSLSRYPEFARYKAQSKYILPRLF